MKNKNITEKQKEELEKFGANTWFVEYLYKQYSNNPKGVPDQWRKFFGEVISSDGDNKKNKSYSFLDDKIPYPNPSNEDDVTILTGSAERVLDRKSVV